jgi:uncharacterized protein YndB with AHSA1/START domain
MTQKATRTITIAPVKKTVTVDVPQAQAFDLFTNGIDRWWPRKHHVGTAPVVKQTIEPRQGGRWVTLHEDGKETVTGRMLEWDPPRRLVLSWEINGQWKPETNLDIVSEVEVRFIAESVSRTRVELEHRNFERMVEGGQTMRDGVDNGWPGILETFKKVAEGG